MYDVLLFSRCLHLFDNDLFTVKDSLKIPVFVIHDIFKMMRTLCFEICSSIKSEGEKNTSGEGGGVGVVFVIFFFVFS